MRFPDLGLFVPALLLSLLGLLVIYSIAPEFLLSQTIYFGIGLIIFFLTSRIDYSVIEAFAGFIFLALIALLLLTLLIGQVIRGSSRWLSLGGIRFQMSEFAKPILIVYLSQLASTVSMNRVIHIGWILGVVAIPTLLVFLQPDLGSSLMLLSIGGYCFLTLNPPKKWLVLIALIGIVGLPSFWSQLAPYQQRRVVSFLQPQADPLGSSYNQIQATIAAGSGQIMGKGLGKGTQSHLKFLPEKHTDFIFASLAEEMGFVGSVLTILLYGSLGARLLMLSQEARSLNLKVIFLGAFMLFILQTTVHMGINLGILPVTGLTLPFISVGGSSMISSWLVLGIAACATATTKSHRAVFLRY